MHSLGQHCRSDHECAMLSMRKEKLTRHGTHNPLARIPSSASPPQLYFVNLRARRRGTHAHLHSLRAPPTPSHTWCVLNFIAVSHLRTIADAQFMSEFPAVVSGGNLRAPRCNTCHRLPAARKWYVAMPLPWSAAVCASRSLPDQQ